MTNFCIFGVLLSFWHSFCCLLNDYIFKEKILKKSITIEEMKKLFLAFICCALPLAFTSCDDEGNEIIGTLTGKMNLTIDGVAYSFTGVGAYTQNGKTYIATTNSKNAVMIQLAGTTTGSYTLGVMNSGANLTSLVDKLISGGLSLSNFDNILTYVPFDNTDATYIVIAGTCKITSVGKQVVGSFSGTAIQKSDISNLNAESLLAMITSGKNMITGNFTAMETSSIISMFGK